MQTDSFRFGGRTVAVRQYCTVPDCTLRSSVVVFPSIHSTVQRSTVLLHSSMRIQSRVADSRDLLQSSVRNVVRPQASSIPTRLRSVASVPRGTPKHTLTSPQGVKRLLSVSNSNHAAMLLSGVRNSYVFSFHWLERLGAAPGPGWLSLGVAWHSRSSCRLGASVLKSPGPGRCFFRAMFWGMFPWRRKKSI